MRLAWFLVAIFAGTAVQTQAAIGYSKEYTQCMNFSYGNTPKAEKCLEKELKFHNKRLKKNYKTYLKLNPNQTAVIRSQHVLWERKLAQQCNFRMSGKYAKQQQGQCMLALIMDQANLYQSRSYASGFR